MWYEEFEVLGGQDVGLKVTNLMLYKAILKEVGFYVPGGKVIAAEVSDALVKENSFSEHVLAETILEKARQPKVLEEINKVLVDALPIGTPIFLRSSARCEPGGIGIYESYPFILDGNKEQDRAKLWGIERLIYASEFTDEAKEWREVQNGSSGMALLLHPVIGKKISGKFGDFFLPILAGDAYTSYYGQPLVRSVIGLGEKAMREYVKEWNCVPPYAAGFSAYMNARDKVSLIDLKDGRLRELNKSSIKIPRLPFRQFSKLFPQMERLKVYGDFHLEWALADGSHPIAVVQCEKIEKLIAEPIEVDNDGNKLLLAESADIVNHGRKICQSIVYAGWRGWSSGCLRLLARVNRQLKNYLLIVPQESFSFLSSIALFTEGTSAEINYSHFSRSGAILEKQKAPSGADLAEKAMLNKMGLPSFMVDHSEMRGGAHFRELCHRGDILFLGAEFDDSQLLRFPSANEYNNLKIWEVDVEVVNDITKGKGVIYLISQPKVIEFTISQLEKFTMALRDAANKLRGDLAHHFYAVHYAIIPWINNPSGFNPFVVDPREVEGAGGREKLAGSIQVVIQEGTRYVDYLWEDIKDYLERLLEHF